MLDADELKQVIKVLQDALTGRLPIQRGNLMLIYRLHLKVQRHILRVFVNLRRPPEDLLLMICFR